MPYLCGKNTIKDTYTISKYAILNEKNIVSLVLLCAEIKNNEIGLSLKNIVIKNKGISILDPDFVKPEGFIESNPNTWGVQSLPKVIDSDKEYWTIFKEKESEGTEKAILETLRLMGEIPNGGNYKE